jgi:AraC-like DNA-binding protein
MDTQPTSAFLPAHLYAPLLDVLVERGHARTAVLDAAGLEAEPFTRSDGYLSLPQRAALVTHACALEAELGRDVGPRVSPMSHGWLSVAALSAPTIREAIDVVAQHFALVSPLFDLSVDATQDSIAIRLVCRWALAPEIERFHVAALCASLHAHMPRLVLRALPGGVEIDAAVVEQPLALADARVHRDALARCRALVAARPNPTETAATVRRVLIASGPPFLDLVGTAKRLATSSRSLRRRLREEGTSFRSLLDEVRSTIADEWLEDPKRTITEIGLDLGYTDAANFTRAYRRANGVSPSAARRQRLGLGLRASA